MLAVVRKVLQDLCQFEPQDELLVGVSGGPDSLALMMLLHELRWKLVIAHLNHQLRPSASEEEEGVRQWAEQIGAGYVSQSVDVAAYAQKYGLSIEQAARHCRYQFLFEQAKQRQVKAVLVAHTADDQVETFLMRLLRGAGSTGLRGMKVISLPNQWSDTIPLVRPLLSIWRSQIMRYLSRKGLTPFMDESNRDNIYTRNSIRNNLIPYLELYNRSARKLIWQTAQLLAAEEEVIQEQEELAWQKVVTFLDEEMVGVDLEKFRQLPQGIRRRIVRRAYRYLYPGIDELEFAQVENVVNTLLAPQVCRRRINKLLSCLRDYEQGYILQRFVLPSDREYPQLRTREALSLLLSGALRVNENWVLQVERVSEPPIQEIQAGGIGHFEAWLDFEVCKNGLLVRSPQPGDRFAPLSMGGRTKKLSDIFIDRKVPIWVRKAYPLICNEDEILWVPGYTISHVARLTPACQQAIHLRFVRTSTDRENSLLQN
ncbi:MAG: tRNA lysidine(34) synthetase TilS [Anaerolineales bacterium]